MHYLALKGQWHENMVKTGNKRMVDDNQISKARTFVDLHFILNNAVMFGDTV